MNKFFFFIIYCLFKRDLVERHEHTYTNELVWYRHFWIFFNKLLINILSGDLSLTNGF